MTWRGSLRTIGAAARRVERAQQKRQRQLMQQAKQIEKLNAVERATHEVEVYENHIELLESVHKECSTKCDWQALQASQPPQQPEYSNQLESAQRTREEAHRPTVIDKWFGRSEAKLAASAAAIEQAKEADSKRYAERLQEYEKEVAEWQKEQKIAEGVLARDLAAFKDAVQEFQSFSNIKELGVSIRLQFDDCRYIEATLDVLAVDVVPAECKTLLKTGRASVKRMTQSRLYEIYQNYICGCALRLASELLALLPFQVVFVHAMGELLNPQTGHQEKMPLLSVAIPGKTLDAVNLEAVQASDCMRNFVHNMAFSKTKGFGPVEKLNPANFTFTPVS